MARNHDSRITIQGIWNRPARPALRVVLSLFHYYRELSLAWPKARGAREPRPVLAGADARHSEYLESDVATPSPQVARKHRIENVVVVSEVRDQRINFALIGICTNKRLYDIRQAAAILKGKRIARGTGFKACREIPDINCRLCLIEAKAIRR